LVEVVPENESVPMVVFVAVFDPGWIGSLPPTSTPPPAALGFDVRVTPPVDHVVGFEFTFMTATSAGGYSGLIDIIPPIRIQVA
jgi:hypothetical protein